jgi:hypothetical protein
MRDRIAQELDLLRSSYPDVEHIEHNGEDWFRLPTYRFPPGWQTGASPVTTAPIVFKISPGHPAQEPYGFLAPTGLNHGGAAPNNTSVVGGVPFEGSWIQFSWAPDGTWTPASDPAKGSNLLSWAWSFSDRLKQGA